jgi:subtilase family serine protease
MQKKETLRRSCLRSPRTVYSDNKKGWNLLDAKMLNVAERTVLCCLGLLVFARVLPGQAPIRDRLVQAISDAQVSVVRHNVRPWAQPENDRGKASDSFKLDHITMVFKPSQTQHSSLTTLLQQLQNPSSASYHKWLTPEQFGSQFGLSQNDLNQVVSWLESQGFVVDEVARGHMWVIFSGTAGQVEEAFHTEIHHYLVQGKTYYANASDPTVPSALADVVLGFRGLDNVRPKPRTIIRRVPPAAHSRFTSSISGDHFLTPNDFETIYDISGLYQSGISGAGQSIAVMGQTDIYTNDITAFRAAAGLPTNDPTVIVIPNSPDPGVSVNDLAEADLDLEWSGGIAPDATLIYVNSGTASGAYDSLQYAVDQGLAPVVSISYGNCEANWSSAELATLEQMAEQANAEGMTIVAPSGDDGATDCDYPATSKSTVTIATHGLAVDVPASLPYVTGVGGTEFNEGAGDYWNSANNSSNGSALSYIPETAWNDTSSTVGLAASGGGASAVFAKPSWQSGAGVPNDGARDVPDIALDASPLHDGYVICSDGSCVNGFRASDQTLNVVGGTSAGAPVFAAILSLVNEETSSGTGQGNVNYVLYPLATQQPTAFHDITTGNNQEPCQKGSAGCPNGGGIGYSAGPGYDQVTGLGSLEVTNFVAEWRTVAAASTQQSQNFDLSISPTSLSIGSGQSGTATITLTAVNGFTGTVNFGCVQASSLSGATCTPSPEAVRAGSATPVTVAVTMPAAASSGVPTFYTPGGWSAMTLVLIFVLLIGVAAHHRHRGLVFSQPGSRIRWSGVAGLLLLCFVAASLSCGGGGGVASSTSTTTSTGSSSSTSTGSSLQVAPVSSIFTVTGSAQTGNGASISHAVLLSVTVK